MRKVAYFKGCLASLSAKELDSSTQALAPKVGLDLVELEAVTCCGAGDIHEAEPDYYLHLNSRILAYAEAAEGKEHVIRQERMNVIHKESLCINCGCCVSECNAMESDPEFLGPQALAKGMRFVGDPRDAAKVERHDAYSGEHGIWECTRCYFCNERCPKGVDPRDAIAKLGAEAMKEGIDDDMGAKHAKWFVTSAKTTGWLRETELVPKTQGVVSSIKEMKFAMGLLKHGKVPPPFPPHVAEGVKEARALYDIVKHQDRQGALGIVQGERALSRLEHETEGGSHHGQGSRDQADVTPGETPTRKGEGE